MAIRSNHYEAAFEGYIRSIPVPCVAVDEAKRALFGDERVKNPDFLLYPRHGLNLVVEVKGKRGKDAPAGAPWENWVTTDDLDGLARWQDAFGPGFRSILAFAYAEVPAEFELPEGRRVVRLPRDVLPVLGDRPGRLRPPSPVARPGLEGGGDGPPASSAAASARSTNGCR